MSTRPDADDDALVTRALLDMEAPDEEVLEAVREGLSRVHVPPPPPFRGIPRQRSRLANRPHTPLRRRRNG